MSLREPHPLNGSVARLRAAPASSRRHTRSGRKIVGVHVDLKGMNFKPDYIPQYLADLASQGVDTVLVEYEDAFPFGGLDVAHDPSVVWTRPTLDHFAVEAKACGIQVIPLQQCLGHLEYVLSWERYRHLAETPESPNTVRLRDPEARRLVLGMLEQVVAAHPESHYIHLGMDEAHGLAHAADRLGADPLDLFLEQLRDALAIVTRAGKRAIIWADMAERHFRPGAFDEFKGRLVLMPWFYFPVSELTPEAPLGGRRRVSRSWLRNPDHPHAPAIDADTTFIEDLPPALQRVLSRFRRRSRMFQPLLEVELWSSAGMEVIGASALRFSRNGPVLPPYHDQFSNVRGWSKAIRRANQLGQIGTSWARATSWYPPNHCIDLQWPIVAELARSMGRRPKPFWPGIPASTIARIFKALGRCRQDWAIEGRIADEMESLAPRLHAHRYEWRSVILMARTMELQRRADAAVAGVQRFHPENRPVDTEWRRLMRLQDALLKETAAMKQRVRRHFERRFHGAAFEEWLRHLFDSRAEHLSACRDRCEANARAATQRYRRPRAAGIETRSG